MIVTELATILHDEITHQGVILHDPILLIAITPHHGRAIPQGLVAMI